MKRRDLFVGMFASVVALILPRPKEKTQREIDEEALKNNPVIYLSRSKNMQTMRVSPGKVIQVENGDVNVYRYDYKYQCLVDRDRAAEAVVNSRIDQLVETLQNPQLIKSLASQGKQIDTKELVRLFQETIQRS